MLQSTVWPQLARINKITNFLIKRTIMEVNYQPPLTVTLNQAANTLQAMSPNAKHFFIGGERSLAVGLKLLEAGNIIAVPTDTIYGLAALAQNTSCVEKLYQLKGRDKNKPIAIALSSIKDIQRWAEIDHLPQNLLLSLLPGPVTLVLKRKPELNPALNPGTDTIGIRISQDKFLRSLCKVLNQPLALTSANISGQQSSLTADEFEHLWPELGGIFYTIFNKKKVDESYRVGSTVVDLTVAHQFTVIREGINFDRVRRTMYRYGMKKALTNDGSETPSKDN